MSLQAGQIIDNKYRIVRLLGEGGMGAVFEGENTRIHRRVAIKVLNAVGSADAATIMRFEREAQAAGRIGSEHILEVLDLGALPDGERYMVMEFLDGETLSDRIQHHKRLSAEQLYPLARQALIGLQAAHQAGIVHRDLKPDNVFIVKQKGGQADFVKIIDFGISKFNALSGDMSMTRTGAVMGTPYYMSPEQAKGAAVDARSDVYSMGVIMYEALSGNVPFDGTTFNELMFKIVLSDPAPLAQLRPDLPPRLVEIVMRAMSRELGARYSSALELMHALDEWMVSEHGTVQLGAVRVPTPSHVSALPAHASLPQVADAGGFSQHTKASTAGSWASSQSGVTSQPGVTNKRTAQIVAAVSAVAVVLLAAGAFGAYKAFSGESNAAAASGAAPSASAAPPSPAVPVVTPSEPAQPAVLPAATASVANGAPSATAAPAASASALPVVKPTPIARRAPVRAPAPTPKPAPKKPADRDFGY